MIVSEIYEVQDCIGYNTLTSSASNTLINLSSYSSMISYDSTNGMTFNDTTSGFKYINLNDTYNEPIIIEFDLVNAKHNSNFDYSVPIFNLTNVHGDYNGIFVYPHNSSHKSGYRGNSGDILYSTVMDYLGHWKIVYTSNSEFSYYIDDVLCGSVSNASISTKGLSIGVGQDRQCTIKNLKIKPL